MSLIQRLAAAATSIVITFALFSAVVSEAQPRVQGVALAQAAATVSVSLR
jgi:hypothetical protein